MPLTSQAEPDEEPAPDQARILLAEDDTAQRLLYTRILIGAGYYVLGADNGDDAVDIALRERPNLVLMDVTMPGRDGWSATRTLKDDERTRDIPVVLMTGLTGIATDAAARASGCDQVMGKPIPIRSLLSTVAGYLTPPSGTRVV